MKPVSATGFIFTLFAAVASAQLVSPPATFTPGSPTASDQIRATFTAADPCTRVASTTVTGNLVRTNVVITNCLLGPELVQTPISTLFGPLPAGTYTYEIHVSLMGSAFGLRSSQPLVVQDAHVQVPALSGWSLAIVALTLAVFGWFVLSRGTLR